MSDESQAVEQGNEPEVDVFAEGMDEEAIGKLFNAPKTADAKSEGDSPQAEAEESDGEEEPEAKPEEKPEEPKNDDVPGDDELILPLSTGETKLTGNEVCDLVEIGMTAKQYAPRIQEAFAFQERMMPLVQALQNDPGLVAHLQAYGQQGQPQAQDDPYAGNDEVAAFKQSILREAAQMLLPQLTAQVEQKYKPFVDTVTTQLTAQQQRRAEKIMSELRADPDYNTIHQQVFTSVGDAVAAGKLNAQDASAVYAALQNDPGLYAQAFKHLKEKNSGKQTVNIQAKQVRKVVRAPKLENAEAISGGGDEKEVKARRKFAEALGSGDPSAIGKLY